MKAENIALVVVSIIVAACIYAVAWRVHDNRRVVSVKIITEVAGEPGVLGTSDKTCVEITDTHHRCFLYGRGWGCTGDVIQTRNENIVGD